MFLRMLAGLVVLVSTHVLLFGLDMHLGIQQQLFENPLHGTALSAGLDGVIQLVGDRDQRAMLQVDFENPDVEVGSPFKYRHQAPPLCLIISSSEMILRWPWRVAMAVALRLSFAPSLDPASDQPMAQ